MSQEGDIGGKQAMRRVPLWGVMATLLLISGAEAEAQRLDRRVRIINDTGYDMVAFYASNIARPGWEEDILGHSILGAGRSVIINVNDGSGYCMFDFKAVFADGSQVVDERMNVCEITSHSYYDRYYY